MNSGAARATPALGGEAATNRQRLLYQARLAKRRLFLRDPDLAPLQRILFVKRQAYEPSHNYSDIFDPQGGPGGGVCVLDIPREKGRLAPGQAKLTTLFDARNGVARDPALTTTRARSGSATAPPRRTTSTCGA